MFAEISEKKDEHMKFHEQFGDYLHFGFHADLINWAKIAELLLFSSSTSANERIYEKST